MRPKLIIMVGNIVSGKSTWIKKYLAKSKALNEYFCEDPLKTVVLSKDEIRRMLGAGSYIYDENLEPIIHTCLLDMVQNFMFIGVNIICDQTNMDAETRKPLLTMTKKFHRLGYDYKTIAVVMPNPSKEKIIKRITYREGKLEWAPTPKEVWLDIWEKNNSKFEMPTKEEEGFDIIWEM